MFEDLEGGEGPEDDDCEDADEDEAGHAENDATSCREEDDRWRKERKTIFPAALRRTHSLEAISLTWPDLAGYILVIGHRQVT